MVGLLELFAGHGQNRFYRQLEEWLSSITRLGFAGGDVEQGQEFGAIVQVLDSMAEQMEGMRRQQLQADTERAQLDQALGLLVEAIDRLAGSGSVGGSDPTLERIAAGQEQILAYYQRDDAQGGPHSDAEIRMRLRNIDGQLLRISEELSAGRLETTADLRSDLSTLTLAVRQLSRAGLRIGTQGRSVAMALSRRGSQRDVSGAIWPGFVDAMTALLLVLMFVLSIFMIVQFVLRDTISAQDPVAGAERRGCAAGQRAGPVARPRRRPGRTGRRVAGRSWRREARIAAQNATIAGLNRDLAARDSALAQARAQDQ